MYKDQLRDIHEREQLELEATSQLQPFISKQELDKLLSQSDYLLESIDKLCERFSGMGRTMMENNTKLTAKIEDNVMPRLYMVRPNKSEQIGNLSVALANAKVEFTPMKQSGEGNRGTYSTIDDIKDSIDPALKKYELSYKFMLVKNEYNELDIILTLSHSSNQWIESCIPLNDAQVQNLPFHQKIGSAEKYLRRYMLRDMLCLGDENE